jgi:hypothetical protein
VLSVLVMSLRELHTTSGLRGDHDSKTIFLSFFRYTNSIAILFTYVSDQSTQPTLLAPIVPFLIVDVHITFCPKNTQTTKSCTRSSPQLQRCLTFHWCRSSTVEYVHRSIAVCASAGRTGHFRDPSMMPSRQWAPRRIIICHFHLGQSSGPSSFSICTLKSLVVDMLRLILSLHVTGTITITFTI